MNVQQGNFSPWDSFQFDINTMAQKQQIKSSSVPYIMQAALTAQNADHLNNRLKDMVAGGYITAGNQQDISAVYQKYLKNVGNPAAVQKNAQPPLSPWNAFQDTVSKLAQTNQIKATSIPFIIKAASTATSIDHLNNRLKDMVTKGHITESSKQQIFIAYNTYIKKGGVPGAAPQPAAHAAPPKPVAPAPAPAPAKKPATPINDNTPFQPGDPDWSGYTQDEVMDLEFADNCCAYPKLALYLSRHHPIDIHTACQLINQASKQISTPPDKQLLKPSDVLKLWKPQ